MGDNPPHSEVHVMIELRAGRLLAAVCCRLETWIAAAFPLVLLDSGAPVFVRGFSPVPVVVLIGFSLWIFVGRHITLARGWVRVEGGRDLYSGNGYIITKDLRDAVELSTTGTVQQRIFDRVDLHRSYGLAGRTGWDVNVFVIPRESGAQVPVWRLGFGLTEREVRYLLDSLFPDSSRGNNLGSLANRLALLKEAGIRIKTRPMFRHSVRIYNPSHGA